MKFGGDPPQKFVKTHNLSSFGISGVNPRFGSVKSAEVVIILVKHASNPPE
jgi:hypothetical protein